MSQLKPYILMNPLYTTNSIDTNQSGFYQISPNTNNVTLRVGSNQIGLTGEIYLNKSILPNPVFQGYNGSSWVNFNATQGQQGIPGKDFTNAVNFNNLGSNIIVEPDVTLASIFASTFVDIASNISNVNIRSLEGGVLQINSNLSIDSIVLRQNSNVITMTSQPLPYQWDFTSNNTIDYNTVSYLKNTSIDTPFYGWGDTSNWIVKQGETIKKGQAVRISKETSSSNIVIIPITYTSYTGINPFTNPINMLGIATEDVTVATAGQKCRVCTKGITTVLCTNQCDSTAGFLFSQSISTIGIFGIVGKDGGIFSNTQPSPTSDYIIAGYFLETGSTVAANNNYALFYVEPKIQLI